MSNLTLSPEIRPNKNLIFKGKTYPVDFEIIKHYSNYFNDKQNYYEQLTNIELPEEKIEISDEDFQNFVSCCQNQNFQLTDSNVLCMHQLSISYDVPGLQRITNEYISKNKENLIFSSLTFKCQNQLDSNSEEDAIASNFEKYINDDRLFSIPISILHRILNNKNLKISQDKMIEFLFKCIDKKHYGRKASILFCNFNFENKKIELYSKLINDYSDVFDFNMINPKFLLSTTNELLSELNKLRIEYSNSMIEMKKLIENQNKQFNDQIEIIKKLQNEHKDQISKQNESFIKAENDRKNKFDEQLKQYEDSVKNLNDQNESKFELIKRAITKSIQYNPNEPGSGIINYLLKESKGAIENEINVTSSSVLYNNIPQNVLHFNTNEEFYAEDGKNNWICFEFKNHKIIPNKYSVISYDGGTNSRHPKSWVIQGSNDNENWDTISEEIDCPYLNKSYTTYTFDIKKQNNQDFKFIRMLSTGPSWNNKNSFAICAFEVYGELI